MGEVRAQVALTNIIDEERADIGEIAVHDIRTYDADALIDTGAVASAIPVHVVEMLGLKSRRRRVVELADGSQQIVDVVEGLRFRILNRDTTDEAFVIGDEVLIGQTVLEKLDLLVDCAGRQLTPHPDHPDQPVLKLK
jgi:clan AA aspartic protease